MLRRVTERLVASGHPLRSVALAFGVHALTASGGVVGVAALLEAAEGDLRASALWMLLALTIDAVDGTLARMARVHEVLPGIDGRRLDDIVDYLNYVVVPAVFLVQAGSVVHWTLAAAPVLSSAYGFAQSDAKTDDHFFVGFPSYWNVVAIYLWCFAVDPRVGSALVLLLAAAVFVPVRYLYPSRMSRLWWTTNVGAALWVVALAAALAFPTRLARLHLVGLSLLYPAYYVLLSFHLGGIQRRRA
jgi:phosphatidylcholine synthase